MKISALFIVFAVLVAAIAARANGLLLLGMGNGGSINSYIANAVHLDNHVGVGTTGAITSANNTCQVTLIYTTRGSYSQSGSFQWDTFGGSDFISNSQEGTNNSETINGINITSDASGYRVNLGDGSLHYAVSAAKSFPISGYTDGNWATWLVSIDVCTSGHQYIQAYVIQPGTTTSAASPGWTQVYTATAQNAQTATGFGTTLPMNDAGGFALNGQTTSTSGFAQMDMSDFIMWTGPSGVSAINAGKTGVDGTMLANFVDNNGHIYSPSTIISNTGFGTPTVLWSGSAASYYLNQGSGNSTGGIEAAVPAGTGAVLTTTFTMNNGWAPWGSIIPNGSPVRSSVISVNGATSVTIAGNTNNSTYTLSSAQNQANTVNNEFGISSGVPIVDLAASPSLASPSSASGNPSHKGNIRWRCGFDTNPSSSTPTATSSCNNSIQAGDVLLYVFVAQWANSSIPVGNPSCSVPSSITSGAVWNSWVTGSAGYNNGTSNGDPIFLCAAYMVANSFDAAGTGAYTVNLTPTAAYLSSFSELIDYGPGTVDQISSAPQQAKAQNMVAPALSAAPSTSYDLLVGLWMTYKTNNNGPYLCPGMVKRIDNSYASPPYNPPLVLICDLQLTSNANASKTATMTTAAGDWSQGTLLAITPQ